MDNRKTVITYGTYDLLHHGHVRLLERAKELGDYLIVGVTSDQYDKERGKLNVSQTTLERVEAVKALGIADKIIIEEYEGQKISDIKKYGVDIFTVGSDWVGYFDYLNDYCDVVYLDRTQGISSTQLRSTAHAPLKGGIIGSDRFADRFYDESAFVGGLDIIGFCPSQDTSPDSLHLIDKSVRRFSDEEELLAACDAVFIFGAPAERHKTILRALDAGLHTWFAAPGFLSVSAAQEAQTLAKRRGALLMEGMRTAFLPAFEHLVLMARSGKIGSIVDIALSCTQNPPTETEAATSGSFCEWGPLGMLPIFKLLGTDYVDLNFSSIDQGGSDLFTRCNMQFSTASSTFSTGTGIKTENDMIVTGTGGFIYVPAPWWKTDYFEIRHEDLRDTKKVFYQYAGEGMRHGIMEFVRAVNNGLMDISAHPYDEVLAQTAVLESFLQQKEKPISRRP